MVGVGEGGRERGQSGSAMSMGNNSFNFSAGLEQHRVAYAFDFSAGLEQR